MAWRFFDCKCFFIKYIQMSVVVLLLLLAAFHVLRENDTVDVDFHFMPEHESRGRMNTEE